LSTYTGTVAHQLKNSVFLILGYADLLNDAYQTMTNDERRDCILSITESVTTMQTIILRLLRADAEIQPLDMEAIAAEALRRLTHLISRYQAEVIVPTAWPTALGCRDWVEEVWVNYLSNALKYGGSPPRVELGGDTQTNGMVRFWVRDNGRGLAAEQQARVFVKGTRLQPASVEGHGRGLSIVQDYIHRLGGQVGVESGVGQGSVFFFTLPGVTCRL
jgi:signal transduction histidine kinase